MKKFLLLTILFNLWGKSIAQERYEDVPTYQIENDSLSSELPNPSKLGSEMTELEEDLSLKSEQEMRLIVDSYQTEPETTSDEVASEMNSEMASDENGVTSENRGEVVSSPSPTLAPETKSEIQDLAPTEQSAILKQTAPEEGSEGMMMEGDIMDNPENAPLLNNSSLESFQSSINEKSDATNSDTKMATDEIKTGRAAPVRETNKAPATPQKSNQVFEFPENKKDSFFPVMELPRVRKQRSR